MSGLAWPFWPFGYNFQLHRTMQQISQTQQRLEHRIDSQRLKNKYKTPAFHSHERLRTNPESSRRTLLTPGRLYLRSINHNSNKDYYTIDTDLEPLDSLYRQPLDSGHREEGSIYRQEGSEVKGFEKLPRIKRLPKKTEPHLKRYLNYKSPTVNWLLQSEGKQRNLRNYDHKRICSVNCLTHDQRGKRRKSQKPEKHNSSDRENALSRYLANQYKARYPSTQVKEYLAGVRHKEGRGREGEGWEREGRETRQKEGTEQDRKYYQTFFGLQPEFYKLQTEYALEVISPKQFEPSRFTSYNPVSLPAIPKRQDIAEFIENYVSFGKEFNVEKLLKLPNFLVEYTPAELYFGEMVSSQRQGIGIMLTKSSCFEGLFLGNEKVKGSELNSSGIYRGEFRGGKKEGSGEFEWTNGEYYIGDWRDGQRHGNGVWTNKQGDSYNGEWLRGSSQGNGIYMSEGRQYRGDFLDFKKDGWGKEKHANEDVYEGGFKEGLPQGKGIYIWANGTRYEGEFSAGFRNGKGLLSTVDGFVYNGQFLDEKPEGLCEIFMPNGDIYQGYLRNGKKNGRGVLMFKQSRRQLDGYWQNDFFISQVK